jgi:hypothetical protein
VCTVGFQSGAPFAQGGALGFLELKHSLGLKLSLEASSILQATIKAARETGAPTDETTILSIDPMLVQQPEKILATREIMHRARRVKQVLVKWSLMPKQMSTWEDELTLPRNRFRSLQTEDSLFLKAEGM